MPALLSLSRPVADARRTAAELVTSGADLRVVADRWAIPPGLLKRWAHALREGHDPFDVDRTVLPPGFLEMAQAHVSAPVAQFRELLEQLLDSPRDLVDDRLVDQAARLLRRAQHQAGDLGLVADLALGAVTVTARTIRIDDLLVSVAQAHDDVEVGDMDPAARLVHADPALLGWAINDVVWVALGATRGGEATARIEVHDLAPWAEVRVTVAAAPPPAAQLFGWFEPTHAPRGGRPDALGLYPARYLMSVLGGMVGLDARADRLEVWLRVPQPVDGSAGGPARSGIRCGDVIPGCEASVLVAGHADDAVLSSVVRHLAAAHGIDELDDETRGLVLDAVHRRGS